MSDVSLNERLFWPTVAFAVLALGGFGYFASTKMFRSMPVSNASIPTRTSAPSEIQTRAALENVPDNPPHSPTDSTEPAVASAEPAPAAKPEEMEDGPYVLPDRAPLITRETFRTLPPPKAPAKRPVAAAKTPAVPKSTAPTKSTSATVAAKSSSAKLEAPKIPLIPAPRFPTYVLNDGRRIPAAKVVDMGEFWGLKTTAGQIVTIKKDDVKEIER